LGQVVRFCVGGRHVAFPVANVREVVPLGHVSAVFNAPAFVEGLINVRGEAVPLFDLATLLDFRAGQLRNSLAVIVESGRHVAGFCGSRPVDIVEATGEAEALPGDAGSGLSAVRLVLKIEGNTVLVLDPARVFELPAVSAVRSP